MVEKAIQRLAAEDAYRDELTILREWDTAPAPPGWLLSPFAVEHFILGNDKLGIESKFVAPRELLTRVIISLATNRGVMLIGEPGTAKSLLSELLACAVSGHSQFTIQGGAVSHYKQLLYGWNEALLQRDGPSIAALIPGPIYRGMAAGQLVRFEELARCPAPVQDAILSVLSERKLHIPELSDDAATLYARDGFNIIATSNSLDKGLNDMSAALKRRMNFETIAAISDLQDEIDVVQREANKLLQRSGVAVTHEPMIIEMLVTVFHELRNGQTISGRSTDRLAAAVMSTAEAVSVAHAMGVYAHYYGDGKIRPADMIHFLLGATLKDNLQDRRRVKHYFDTEVVNKLGSHWRELYEQSNILKA